MTAQVLAPRPVAPTRSVMLRGRRVPVILPTRRDPRLRLAVIITSLQVLGQTVLGFKVSVAQILVSVGTCAVVELVVVFWQRGVLMWPASALLTGNSVAFILRASGTRHGDWWSLNGAQYFVAAGLLSLLSKYLIQPGGRHIFNPSNVGLVAVLLVVGITGVFPQYLWWGSIDLPVELALGVILVGFIWVLRPVGMIPMTVSFMATFSALMAIFAAHGACFTAIWHSGRICGSTYWVDICTSPELLVFVFFMMSDPATAPRSRVGRLIFGAATALVAAGLISFQSTEFGVKLAILSSLTVVCGLVPLIEWTSRRIEARRAPPAAPAGATAPALPGSPPRLAGRLLAAARRPAVLAAVIVAVAAPVDTATLAGNQQVTNIERGLVAPGAPNPQ